MRSFMWPKMFNTNSSNIWKSSEYLSATKQNMILLLNSFRGELLGDPYFGLLLKQYLFSQNSYVLRDILTDHIYTQAALFIPQVRLKRKDITVTQDKEKGKVYVRISGINQIDFQPNTYDLIIFTNDNK